MLFYIAPEICEDYKNGSILIIGTTKFELIKINRTYATELEKGIEAESTKVFSGYNEKNPGSVLL